MTTITQQTKMTKGQTKQIIRFGSDAIERALDELGLDNPGAQLVIHHGDEYAAAICKAAKASLMNLSVSDKFKDEEALSEYTYPEEYKGPKPIDEQIKAVAKIFGLSPDLALKYVKEVLPTLTLPDGAEGWFATPSDAALAAKHLPEVTDQAEQYCRAAQLVLDKIGKSRPFHNYREGKITSEHLRVHIRTAEAMKLIAKTQPGDILIIPAQLGMRHRGKSVRRAREVFRTDEFGLGSLAIGSIVLVHPERLVRYSELDMDCAGDEFAPGAGGDFSDAPCFVSLDGNAEFGTNAVGCFDDAYGSASAFSLQ